MLSKFDFFKILELIYLSKFEEAGEALSMIRQCEDFSFEIGLLKKLLLFRLAIKSSESSAGWTKAFSCKLYG